MPDPVALTAAAVAGAAVTAAALLSHRRPVKARVAETSDEDPRASGDPDAGSQLEFVDVCEAAARAKTERRIGGDLTRDYVDGADGVMAELLAAGHGTTPEEMELAYKAGGDDVELDSDSGNPLAHSADEMVDAHLPDDLQSGEDGQGDGGAS